MISWYSHHPKHRSRQLLGWLSSFHFVVFAQTQLNWWDDESSDGISFNFWRLGEMNTQSWRGITGEQRVAADIVFDKFNPGSCYNLIFVATTDGVDVMCDRTPPRFLFDFSVSFENFCSNATVFVIVGWLIIGTDWIGSAWCRPLSLKVNVVPLLNF